MQDNAVDNNDHRQLLSRTVDDNVRSVIHPRAEHVLRAVATLVAPKVRQLVMILKPWKTTI